jgi:hypothetical protein
VKVLSARLTRAHRTRISYFYFFVIRAVVIN